MGFPAPSKLFFLAAILFLCAMVVELWDRGFEPESLIGLAMAGVMVGLGMKARNGRAA